MWGGGGGRGRITQLPTPDEPPTQPPGAIGPPAPPGPTPEPTPPPPPPPCLTTDNRQNNLEQMS
jgi:hypothetical protein